MVWKMRPGMMTRTLCFVLMAALLLAPAAVAEDAIRINKGIQDPTGIEFFINILDESGNSKGPGTSYGVDSYDVWHDSDSQPIAPDQVDSLMNFNKGTHYYFCVDSSATVQKDELKGIQDALSSFFIGLNPAPNTSNKASLWTFGEKITHLADRSSDSSALREMAEKLTRNENWTHLFEVIYNAVTSARNQTDVDNAFVIIITDGADDQGDLVKKGQSTYDFEAIKQTAQLSGVPIYGIMLPVIPNKKSRNPNTSELQQLCQLSGGQLLQMQSSVTELPAMLDRIRSIADDTTVVHIPAYNDGTMTKANEVFKMVLRQGDSRINSMSDYTVMNLNAANWPAPTPTPTPEPTSTPTPRPTPPPNTATPTVEVTVTPTEVPSFAPVTAPPTVSPTPTPDAGFLGSVKDWFTSRFSGEKLKSNWWMLAAAGVLLIGIIILLIVLIGGMRKRKKGNSEIRSTTDSNIQSNKSEIGTVRSGLANAGKTEEIGGTRRSLLNDTGSAPTPTFDPTKHASTGTTRLDDGVPFMPAHPNLGGGISFSDLNGGAPKPAGGGAGGTVRMTSGTPQVAAGGTVRMVAKNRGLELTIEEKRPRDRYEQTHTLYLDEELYIGRVQPCELIIQDENVSSKHLRITKETDGLYIADNNSTNGTKVNGEELKSIRPLRSGDVIIIGVTTLKIIFEEA